jgi:hypothetical protein
MPEPEPDPEDGATAWRTGDKAINPPKSVEWCIDSAKWIVLLITGALGYGIQLLKDRTETWFLWLFALSALVLVYAAAMAVLYLFVSVGYAGQRELGRTAQETRSSKLWSDNLYKRMLASFVGGMFAFIAVNGVAIVAASSPAPPDRGKLQAVQARGPLDPIALYQRDGQAWVLRREAGGVLRWRRLPLP